MNLVRHAWCLAVKKIYVFLILGVNLLQFLLHLQLITLFNLHLHLLYFLPEQKLDGMWNGFS